MHRSFDQGPSLGPGFTFAIAGTNKPPRNKMALHNSLLLLLMNLSFGWAQLRGPSFRSLWLSSGCSWAWSYRKGSLGGMTRAAPSLGGCPVDSLSLRVFQPPGLLHLV